MNRVNISAREEQALNEGIAASRTAFHALQQTLPYYTPKRWYYYGLRLCLQTIGKLSDGIRLGWQAGFDSGRMLDYVYADQAKGITPLGKWIDRLYLDSPGWRGIRERGRNLHELLLAAVWQRRAKGRPVHILDVAGGAGHYLLSTLAELNDPQVSACCRDYDERNLDQGQRRAGALDIQNIRFEQGDAFDAKTYARPGPRADIVVVSGLYELFEENALIRRSLSAIHEHMVDNGCLIYTNQPHHPQLELIARTLINREGRPWIMRPRSQAEMNALVRAAGFEPGSMRQDRAGIFTVSMATKRSRAS